MRNGKAPQDGGHFEIVRPCNNPKCKEVLHQLKELVRCIREFQLGDYSPLMDEIFDSEAAIKEAERKYKRKSAR
jgi:hypothetical protein